VRAWIPRSKAVSMTTSSASSAMPRTPGPSSWTTPEPASSTSGPVTVTGVRAQTTPRGSPASAALASPGAERTMTTARRRTRPFGTTGPDKVQIRKSLPQGREGGETGTQSQGPGGSGRSFRMHPGSTTTAGGSSRNLMHEGSSITDPSSAATGTDPAVETTRSSTPSMRVRFSVGSPKPRQSTARHTVSLEPGARGDATYPRLCGQYLVHRGIKGCTFATYQGLRLVSAMDHAFV
jgi:hypothetical protein